MFDFFKKKEKGIEIGSPVKGKTVAISNVSDPTFGEEILGKGVAIIPAEGRIYAPADGTIEMLFDTMHAVSMTTSEGVELLIHIGLDTVALKGEHFTAYKGNGDSVKKGELLIEADLDAVKCLSNSSSIALELLYSNNTFCSRSSNSLLIAAISLVSS